jgi:hypothetical protein
MASLAWDFLVQDFGIAARLSSGHNCVRKVREFRGSEPHFIRPSPSSGFSMTSERICIRVNWQFASEKSVFIRVHPW